MALHDCCSDHAAVCGGGVGVFFLPLLAVVVCVRNDRLASVTSLYVDSHGEEDPMFERGRYGGLAHGWAPRMLCVVVHRSTFLQASRQEYATTLWKWAAFDLDTRLLRAENSALVPNHAQWYMFVDG